MPWKEVIRLLLKRKLAVVCFVVICIAVFVAVTANFWVSDADLRSKPKVDSNERIEDDRKQEILARMVEESGRPIDAQAEAAAAAEAKEWMAQTRPTATNLVRSYQPPGRRPSQSKRSCGL